MNKVSVFVALFALSCFFCVPAYGALPTYIQQDRYFGPCGSDTSLFSVSILQTSQCISNFADNRSVFASPSIDAANNITVNITYYNATGCGEDVALFSYNFSIGCENSSFPFNASSGSVLTASASSPSLPFFNFTDAQEIQVFAPGTCNTASAPYAVTLLSPVCRNTTQEGNAASLLHVCNSTHLLDITYTTENCTGTGNITWIIASGSCVNNTYYSCYVPPPTTTSTSGTSTTGNTTATTSTLTSTGTGHPTTSTSTGTRSCQGIFSALFAMVCVAFVALI